MSPSERSVAMVHAIARVGAVAVPLNLRQSTPELVSQLRDSGPSLVVHDDALGAKVGDPGRRTDARRWERASELMAESASGGVEPVLGGLLDASSRARHHLHLGLERGPQGRRAHTLQPDVERHLARVQDRRLLRRTGGCSACRSSTSGDTPSSSAASSTGAGSSCIPRFDPKLVSAVPRQRRRHPGLLRPHNAHRRPRGHGAGGRSTQGSGSSSSGEASPPRSSSPRSGRGGFPCS